MILLAYGRFLLACIRCNVFWSRGLIHGVRNCVRDRSPCWALHRCCWYCSCCIWLFDRNWSDQKENINQGSSWSFWLPFKRITLFASKSKKEDTKTKQKKKKAHKRTGQIRPALSLSVSFSLYIDLSFYLCLPVSLSFFSALFFSFLLLLDAEPKCKRVRHI